MGRAKLSVTDQRRSNRVSVNFVTEAEHRRLGSVTLHVANISPQGLMAMGEIGLQPGERLGFRLPSIGLIDGHLVWTHEGRMGFQFERVIRPNDFTRVVDQLESKELKHERLPPRQ